MLKVGSGMEVWLDIPLNFHSSKYRPQYIQHTNSLLVNYLTESKVTCRLFLILVVYCINVSTAWSVDMFQCDAVD